MAALRGRYYYAHFTCGEIEAQVTCPKASNLASLPMLSDSLTLLPKTEIWESGMTCSLPLIPLMQNSSSNPVESLFFTLSYLSLLLYPHGELPWLRPLCLPPACLPLSPSPSCPISNHSPSPTDRIFLVTLKSTPLGPCLMATVLLWLPSPPNWIRA